MLTFEKPLVHKTSALTSSSGNEAQWSSPAQEPRALALKSGLVWSTAAHLTNLEGFVGVCIQGLLQTYSTSIITTRR